MEYYVTVTTTFTEIVEADSSEEAEDLVRNMDWADIPKLIEVNVEENDNGISGNNQSGNSRR